MERVRILDPKPDLPTVRETHRRAVELLPQLREAKITDAWAGFVDSTPDGVPGIGEVPAVPGVLPTMTVTERMTLRRGSRLIDIRSMGPGHSQADLIVHLPAEKIVIAGDLVIWPVPLTGLKSSIKGWATALDRIRELQPAVIVPGHGPIMRDDSYLKQLGGLFTSLAQQVDASVAKGATLEDTRASVHLDDWRSTFAGTSQLRGFLFDYYVTGPGVAAAYREATQKTSSH